MLSIHPEPAKRISDFGATAVDSLSLRKNVEVRKPAKAWSPDRVSYSIDSADMLSPLISYSESSPASVRWEHKGRTKILEGKPAEGFFSACELVWRSIRPKDAVSYSAVRASAIEWLFSEKGGGNLAEYCQEALSKGVQEQIVWVPVHGLCIEEDIQIASVLLTTVSIEMAKSWFSFRGNASHSTEDKAAFDEYNNKRIKAVQGFAVGVAKVFGDQDHARSLALESVSDALAILRFNTPPALDPTRISYIVPRGQEHFQRYEVILDRGGGLTSEQSGVLSNMSRTWDMRKGFIDIANEMGLQEIAELLKIEDPTKFQQTLLSAVKLFSEATLHIRMESKLLYLLAALESLFLKDGQEAIGQNLGERLAFILGKNLEERQNITSCVKNIYRLRSRFVHHGKPIEGEGPMRQFMPIARQGIRVACDKGNEFKTVLEFATWIDRIKFS